MTLPLVILLFYTGQTKCAKPQSVNLALETVLEFNNESDITFVDTVQDFLNKVKSTLQESFRSNRDRGSRSFHKINIESLPKSEDKKGYRRFAKLSEVNEKHSNTINKQSKELYLQKTTYETNIQSKTSHHKSALQEETRRFGMLSFTDFIEDSVNVLKTYNDLDLTYFMELLDTEINNDDYKNCEIHVEDFGLRRYISNKISNARDTPIKHIRQGLSNIVNDLRNNDKMGILYSFLNSLVKRHTQQRFKSILNHLQLYRRRQMNPINNLRSIVRDSIRSIITDYICNLNDANRRKIRSILKMILEEDSNSKKLNKYLSKQNSILRREEKKRPHEKENKKSKLDDESTITSSEEEMASFEQKEKIKNAKQKHHGRYSYQEAGDKTVGEKVFKEKKIKKQKNKTSWITNKDDTLDLTLNFENYKDSEITLFSKETNLKATKRKTTTASASEFSRKHSTNTNFEDDSSVKKKSQRKIKRLKPPKHLKTFVTLYPERIHIYTKMFQTENKKTTKVIRKGFTVKSINTEKVMSVGVKSTEVKNNASNVSLKKRFKIKSNRETTHKRHESKGKTQNPDTSFTQSVVNESEALDHYGSLYKQKLIYPDVIYRKKNGYRKSNLDDVFDPRNLTNDVFTEEFLDKVFNQSDLMASGDVITPRTFGTLAFWSGTKSRTLVTVYPRNFTNMTDISIDSSSSTQATVFQGNNASNPKVTVSNTTENAVQSRIVNRSQMENTTKILIDIQQINNTNTANATEITSLKNLAPKRIKEMDLRRLLGDTIVEDRHESVKKELDERFQEDLKKIFLTSKATAAAYDDSTKDPIDEIGEAFDIS
ncbi:unnamed protein product [Leptosia nina]|uniref:Uncharacterized protein n=1 Tax=Leptosia nina TaxID=320188 RepID=A0AAV1JXU2_9NEOP